MYELGYRSVEQITQLLSRFANVIVTVKNEGPASAAFQARNNFNLNHMDREMQFMEANAPDENRQRASVLVAIFRLIGNILRRISTMKMKGSKLLDMIIEGACDELYHLVRKAGGKLGFNVDLLSRNTLPA